MFLLLFDLGQLLDSRLFDLSDVLAEIKMKYSPFALGNYSFALYKLTIHNSLVHILIGLISIAFMFVVHEGKLKGKIVIFFIERQIHAEDLAEKSEYFLHIIVRQVTREVLNK
jgi:hypothetical protein